jgi:hypothetical protein
LFPQDPDGVFINLGWEGRREPAAEPAPRFEAMFAHIRKLPSASSLRWYQDTARRQPILDEVPSAGPELAGWIEAATEEAGEWRL